jgi:23S rRNA (guanosine2251-2'-O)-methyltransferase
MYSMVSCPSPQCQTLFEVESSRLGRNIFCIHCGIRMTARMVSARIQVQEQEERLKTQKSTQALPRFPFVVVLDNIRSLWNVGSIFRSADICGVGHLYLTGITGCPPRPEIRKTALGAEEVVSWTYYPHFQEALDFLEKEGYALIALECSPSALPLAQMHWPASPFALLLGNEVSGIQAEGLQRCISHTFIPRYGIKESLNVAVAFGIAAYQIATSLASSHPSVTPF